MEKYFNEIVNYFVENIEDYEERCQKALDIIGEWRCPLSMADSSLYGEMLDYLEEWANECDEEIDIDEIDIEDLFWHC